MKLSLLLLVVLLAVMATASAQQVQLSSCTSITQPGIYFLANDIINSSAEVCIDIASSDVILDGQGHVIDGIDDTTNETKGISAGYTNVTITNLTVKDWKYGILLQLSNESRIVNVTSTSNEYGIYMPGSNNTMITNNTIVDNGVGIWLLQAYNNTIYNNLFNNTLNVDLTFVGANSWNTSLSSGLNIIDGSYIGGNAWFKPDGTGYSETCSDADGNGICDQPYVLDQNNTDYLPLAKPISAPTNLETIPDSINDSLEKIVTKYYPAFDWQTQTPTRQDVVNAVINAVTAYFSSDQAARQEILNDVIKLVTLYFTLPG